MVERIDERQRRRAIESSAVVQGGRDADRCLVDIGDAEIDFPHDGVVPHNRGERRRGSSSMEFQPVSNSGIIIRARQADAACSNCRDVFRDGGVCEMQVVMVLMSVGFGTNVIGCREPWGITMLAWTWNDRTNGREGSSETHG